MVNGLRSLSVWASLWMWFLLWRKVDKSLPREQTDELLFVEMTHEFV